jgi:UDP-N-acetylmuramate dehydrogenase
LNKVKFSNADCRFGYRESRFKAGDLNTYIITEVKFRLKINGEPEIKYPELINHLLNSQSAIPDSNKKITLSTVTDPIEKLNIVRNAVFDIRRNKSMVLDENDPDSISCGSFFINPVISEEEFKKLQNRWLDKEESIGETIPHFRTENGIKVSAAWLIENAGFKKGYRKNGAGISSKHTLAIINCGGTTKDVIELANKIKDKVFIKFGIQLNIEPMIVT